MSQFFPFPAEKQTALSEHLRRRRYGCFELTDALRPALDLRILPQEGYRRSLYRDPVSGLFVRVVTCAASGEHLFDLFMDTLDILAPTVELALGISSTGRRVEYRRQQCELVILKSIFYDFEKLILHDGSLGLALSDGHTEVSFDEHKLLVISGDGAQESEFLLDRYGIHYLRRLQLLTDSEHIHTTTRNWCHEADRLKISLGLDDYSLF